MARRRYRAVLIWLALAASAVWCVAIGVTAVRVHRLRSELGRLAADIAHHNAAHHPRVAAGSPRYLELALGAGVGRRVRAASLRVVHEGPVEVVEVRLEAVVGFALGGHPLIAIRVTRSAPVEAETGLP